MDKLSDLERLSRLVDDGKLTRDEYDRLKAEIVAGSSSSKQATKSHPQDVADSRDGKSPTAETRTPYRTALVLGIASVFFGGTFGLLAWAAVAVAIWALTTSRAARGRWMAWTGLTLGILFSLVNAYFNGHFDSILADVRAGGPTPASLQEQSVGFLDGMTPDEFEQSWEALVIANDVSSAWMLEERDPSKTWSNYSIQALPGSTGRLRLHVDSFGIIDRATLSSGPVRVGTKGYEDELEAVITAWHLLCYTLDGADGPPNCADEVAEGLGYSFDTLRNWNSFYEPIKQGLAGKWHYTKHLRDGVHWQILIAFNGVVISAGREPL